MAEIIETPGSGGGILPPYGTPTPAAAAYAGATGNILPPENPPLPPYPPIPPGFPPPVLPPPIIPPYVQGGDLVAEASSPTLVNPIDDCMRSVSVTGLSSVIGAPVKIFINCVLRGTGQAIADTIEIPLTGCSPNVSDVVTGTTGIAYEIDLGPITVETHKKYSVLTQHYDNARTGWYQYEQHLDLGKLAQTGNNAFKMHFKLPVDGKPYAQPLYMHHVNFPGLGAKNVVFLATENDTVYAYDADDPGSAGNGVLLWQRSLLQPGERAPLENEGPIYPYFDTKWDINCGDIQPVVGVSATPVISCACDAACCGNSSGCGCCDESKSGTCCPQTLYVVSKNVSGILGAPDSLKFHIYLHALDIVTGTERPNSPVEVSGSVIGEGAGSENGVITFDPKIHNVRTGLLLVNGCIYFGAASHCDRELYHGWIFAYDAKSLKQKAIFCTTPDGQYAPYDHPNGTAGAPNFGIGGGIWQAGQGLASDGEAIFFTTGNGGGTEAGVPVSTIASYNANLGGNNYGNSVLKLDLNLKVKSFFTPADQWGLDKGDADLGSGGVMILPPQLGPHPNQLITLGKDGMIFLLDRDGIGGFAGDATLGQYGANPNAAFTIGSAMDVVIPTSGIGSAGGGIWGGPAFYLGEHFQTIYYGRNGGPITAYNLRGPLNLGDPPLKRRGTTSTSFGNLGTTPTVSSNHQTSSTQLVWAILRDDGTKHTALTVFDAIALRDGVIGVPPAIAPIQIGSWVQGMAFVVPTVCNGKVYAACEDYVGVFYCANEHKVP